MNIFGIILNNADLWLLAIAGACLAWLVPHRLSVWRERNNRRVIASAAFRAAIEKELGPMLTKFPTDSPEIDGRLKHAFPALESAVREFRRHVPLLQRRGFNRVWLIYHCAYPDNWKEGECYHHYLGSHSPEEPPPDSKTIFRANVERLLSYAKET
jgi:hypothetical protein